MSVQSERDAWRSKRRSDVHALHTALVCFVFLCFAIRPAHGQFTRFQNLNDEQGLGNSGVDALAQDEDGYILLGTEAGLYRYDGVNITAYGTGLPSAAWVQQIVVGDSGQTWVVTHDNLYLGHKADFTRVDTGRTSLSFKSPHLLVVADESVVLDAGGVLLRARLAKDAVDRDVVGTFSPLFGPAALAGTPGLGAARFVVPDTNGGLLIGCGDAICRETGGSITVLGKGDGLPPDTWQVALRTPDGTIWARSLDQLAWRRPGQAAFSVTTLPGWNHGAQAVAPGEHSSYVANPERLALLDDRHGGVLTQGPSGLLDWNGSSWRLHPHHPGGLPADRIVAMMLDREGSLWAGSFVTGAYRSIGLGSWEHWTKDDGLPSNIIWSMARTPNGQFWVATDSGTVATDGTPAGIPAETNYVSLTTRGGRLWMAPIGSALIRRDPVRGTLESFPSLGKVVGAAIDGNNRLWLGTGRGLFVVADADQPAAAVHPIPVLAHETLALATDPAGVVWLLSRYGVFRRNESGQFDLVIAPGLLKDVPISLNFAPGNEVWVGTDLDGMLRFRVSGTHVEQLPAIVAPTIASNDILFARRDRRGSVWIGTDHGIDMFDGKSWRHFDSSDGPISSDVDQNAIYEDADGSMWFGTSHGLSHLIDPATPPLLAPLHPLITGLSLGTLKLPLSSPIRADWRPGSLVIDFVDLDYSRGKNIVFHYRLRGIDTGWSTTTGHEVRYAGLPAGQLDFELVAEDTAHGLSSRPVGFTLQIRAPWWRRWWSYGLFGLAFSAIVVGAWQAKVRLLLRNQQRLEDMVRVRTVEIEQARNTLQHQAGELARQASDMRRLAMSDALTGLANRRAIMAALDHAVDEHRSLAVLLCDIDHFKMVNDSFGHLAGDDVLVAFAAALAANIQPGEAVGRYGGEEFLLILPGDEDKVMHRVSAIRSAMTEASGELGGLERTVTSSGGLAFRRTRDTSLSLLARADTALYRAKANGRNRIEQDRPDLSTRTGQSGTGAAICAVASLHDRGPANETSMAAAGSDAFGDYQSGVRADLERELRAALSNSEFTLHYQPIVDIDRDVVTSWEALLRWQSPLRGNVPPGDFIPFAEKGGLMPEIGDWVLRAACREAASWRDGLKVSVNLSPAQFRLPDLVDRIRDILRETGLLPERLELEVTETAMIDDVAGAASTLRSLRALGITVALDDFGTGYSSLSFLRMLPFDRIKIDQSFVQDLGVRPQAVAILRALVGLCVSVGAAATAEGAETDQQIALLRAAGCSHVQGYRLGRPCPASEMQAWLAAFAASRALAPAA